MQTKPVTVSEAKAQLSALLEKVANGERVLLGRRGRPEFEIVRVEPETEPRELGQYEGRLEIADDFDAPIDELADLFEGGAA